MWCSLNTFGCVDFDDLQSVESFLVNKDDVTQREESEVKDDEDTQMDISDTGVSNWDDWSIDAKQISKIDESSSSSSTSSKKQQVLDGSKDLLQMSIIACSSNLELFVMAHEDRFAVFGEKIDPVDKTRKYTSLCMQVTERKDYISSVFCLPLASSRRTETRPHDWTCVIIGTETGRLLFYTERGSLVYKQQFHKGPILSIDFGPSLHGTQELTVFHSNCLVSIEGLSLYTALKGCKSQVARGGPNTAEELSDVVELVFKKWQPDGGEKSCQHIASGPYKPCSFDQLETASIMGGFEAKIDKPALPHFATYCLIGPDPLLTFAWQEDALPQPALSDAFYNLADKFKSSVSSGFLGRFNWSSPSLTKGQPQQKILPISVRPNSMTARTLLQDAGREGERIYLAPGRQLAVVADGHGRVLLVHLTHRRVIRMWKGYRDAECAWIESNGRMGTDQSPGPPNARALFLVIFAPRRSVLEIWTMHNGPRVGAFNVDKNGRLISQCCSLILGLSQQAKSLDESTDSFCSTVAWFLRSDGSIQEITVPFHLALQDASISEAHDDTIIRQLKSCLSDVLSNPEQFLNSFQDFFAQLKTTTARRTTLDLLLSNEKVPVSLLCRLIDFMLNKTTAEQERPLSIGEQILRSHCLTYLQLLNGFAFGEKLNSDSEEKSKLESDENEQDVATLLDVSKNDLECYIMAIEWSAKKDDFETDYHLTFKAMLDCFDLSRLMSSRDVERSKSLQEHEWFQLHLKQEMCAESLTKLGYFLFESVLTYRCSLETFKKSLLPHFGLKAEDLIRILCFYWLEHKRSKPVYPPRLYKLIQVLSETCADINLWLPFVQNEIIQTEHVAEGFTLCLIVRAIAKTQQNQTQNEKSEWEKIQVSLEKWDLCVLHLYCLLLLNCLPRQKPEADDDEIIPTVLSLQELLNRGAGFYREEIGRWCSSFFPQVDHLSDVLSQKEISSDTKEKWPIVLKKLQDRFPLSLRHETVLCDCSWEQSSAWHKEPDNIERLEHSLQLLAKIEYPLLQHGIAFLIWDTFVLARFKALCLLMEKVGRFPKDRLCRKEIGIADIRLVKFAHCCVRLLRILREANADRDYSPSPPIRYEDFLENFFSLPSAVTGGDSTSREPLAELAARQKCTNYQLVLHHWHLALTIYLQLEWSIKPCRPYSLFDDKGKRAFFASLYSYPLLSMADVTDDFRSLRQELCQKCIKQSLDIVKPDTSVIMELYGEWGLDSDSLRKSQVVQLYKMGRDVEAEKLLSAIWAKADLAVELVPILASRIKPFFEAYSSQIDKWAGLSPRSIAWIKNAPNIDKERKEKFDLDSIIRFLSYVQGMISSDNKNSDILNELSQVLSSFNTNK